jgi:phenylacetate-CoA ligase
MSDYFDALETRDPAQREALLLAALPRQVAHAQQHTPAFAQILAGVEASAVNSREALARLPVTRKPALLERQIATRPRDPFGGFSTLVQGPQMPRIFASTGPIYEPEGANADYWRAARAMFAAGFRGGDLVHNSISYHMTPGAFIM